MSIAGIPFDFVLFALALVGVVLFHSRTLQVALALVLTAPLRVPQWGLLSVGSRLKGGWHAHAIYQRAASQPAKAAPAAKP